MTTSYINMDSRFVAVAVFCIGMALWGIPTAVSAFIIHAWNLRRLDAHIRRTMVAKP